MATNDGYQPYPTGLSASEFVAGVNRVINLDTELATKVTIFSSVDEPTTATDSDLWRNTSTGILYRATIEDGITFWFEA